MDNNEALHRPPRLLILAIGLAAMILAVPAPGQDAEEPRSRQPDAVENENAGGAIDEITVYGENSVQAIKAQIIRADRKLYGLFNELNDDRDYDVHCRLEGVYASRRKERICLPAFEHGVLEESWNDLDTWTGAGRPNAEIRKKREIFRQKMMEFAAQNPELEKAIYERANLELKLTEAEGRGRVTPE